MAIWAWEVLCCTFLCWEGPASPAWAVADAKATQLEGWRSHLSISRAIPQQDVSACTPSHYWHSYLRYLAAPWSTRPNAGRPAVGTLIVKWIKTLIIHEWWVLWLCPKGLACREKASYTQPGPLVGYSLLAAVSTWVYQPNKMLHDHYAVLYQLEDTFLNGTEKCTSCCWIGFLPSK